MGRHCSHTSSATAEASLAKQLLSVRHSINATHTYYCITLALRHVPPLILNVKILTTNEYEGHNFFNYKKP